MGSRRQRDVCGELAWPVAAAVLGRGMAEFWKETRDVSRASFGPGAGS